MTNERCAEVIQTIKFILPDKYYNEETEEALDMAIKALEATLFTENYEYKCPDCKNNGTDKCEYCGANRNYEPIDVLESLPSVQPKQKTGEWIRVAGMNERCSACYHYFPLSYFLGRPFEINYCPNCGAKMVEPQESEG